MGQVVQRLELGQSCVSAVSGTKDIPVPSGAVSWPAGAAVREFSEAWLSAMLDGIVQQEHEVFGDCAALDKYEEQVFR